MRLISFIYEGIVYAILLTSNEVKLYTKRGTLEFNNYYEVIDWLKHR